MKKLLKLYSNQIASVKPDTGEHIAQVELIFVSAKKARKAHVDNINVNSMSITIDGDLPPKLFEASFFCDSKGLKAMIESLQDILQSVEAHDDIMNVINQNLPKIEERAD